MLCSGILHLPFPLPHALCPDFYWPFPLAPPCPLLSRPSLDTPPELTPPPHCSTRWIHSLIYASHQHLSPPVLLDIWPMDLVQFLSFPLQTKLCHVRAVLLLCFLLYPGCCSVSQSCPILCDPMDCSTPGSPVFHYVPEFVQTMPTGSVMLSSHLISTAPFSFHLQKPIRVFSNESTPHKVAKVLELQLQHQSFQ